MSSNFKIVYEKNKGNLHVHPSGDFDGSSAWELIHLIHDQYDGQGEVHIDTRLLREMCPFGCSTFQCRLNLKQVPPARLYFKGERGYKIAPNGSNVLLARKKDKCGCSGDCDSCPCKEKKNPN